MAIKGKEKPKPEASPDEDVEGEGGEPEDEDDATGEMSPEELAEAQAEEAGEDEEDEDPDGEHEEDEDEEYEAAEHGRGRVKKAVEDDDPELAAFIKSVVEDMGIEAIPEDAVRSDMGEVAGILKGVVTGVVTAAFRPVIDAINEQAAMMREALGEVAELKKAFEARTDDGTRLSKSTEEPEQEAPLSAAPQSETREKSEAGIAKAVLNDDPTGGGGAGELDADLAVRTKRALDGRIDLCRRAERMGKALTIEGTSDDLSALRRGKLSAERAELIVKSYEAAATELAAPSK